MIVHINFVDLLDLPSVNCRTVELKYVVREGVMIRYTGSSCS